MRKTIKSLGKVIRFVCEMTFLIVFIVLGIKSIENLDNKAINNLVDNGWSYEDAYNEIHYHANKY